MKLEVEERDEIIKGYESDFLKALSKFEIDQKEAQQEDEASEKPRHVVVRSEEPDLQDGGGQQENESEKNDDVISVEDGISRPEWMKKLWKSIALITHPDRTGNDPHMTELYKRASEAWRSGSADVMLEIAAELRLDVPDTDESMLEVLKIRAKDLSKKIAEIESSVLWAWGSAPDDKKEAILHMYVQSRKR